MGASGGLILPQCIISLGTKGPLVKCSWFILAEVSLCEPPRKHWSLTASYIFVATDLF